jgi:hypothetical protein
MYNKPIEQVNSFKCLSNNLPYILDEDIPSKPTNDSREMKVINRI